MAFDAEQHRRTQLVMAALAEQGTVDELGLGPVRDLIAGALHPGLSVLHTRAKYLLFLPRIYGSLSGTSPEGIQKQGRNQEGKLAGDLERYYRETGESAAARGIIGRNTKERAKQPASAAYWPLLRTLGILQGSGSVASYCRDLAEARQQQGARSLLSSEDQPVAVVDSRWIELPAEGELAGFLLSREEAEWLRFRFRRREETTPGAERSLVDHLLDPARSTWVRDVTRAWDHPRASDFPARTREAVELGRDLDQLVHGARILYNHLCAERRPDHGESRDSQLERYEAAMSDWREETRGGLPAVDRLADLDAWVRSRTNAPGVVRWLRTLDFLRRWHEVASSEDLLTSAAAAQLVTRREDVMKPGRARLTHVERLRSWTGDSGYLRFDYNWLVARRLLDDIHAGLETPVETFVAVA